MSEQESPAEPGQRSNTQGEFYKGLQSFDVEQDQARAQQLVDQQREKITDPFAEFNLNTTGLNPEFVPKPETGLPTKIENADRATIEREATTVFEMADPETGQKYDGLFFNRDRRDQHRVLVMLPPFANDPHQQPANYRMAAVARELGVPMLALNHPGVGESEKLTKELRTSLKNTQEGYGDIARSMLRALKEQGITEIDLAGVSMGAFEAVELARVAAEDGIHIQVKSLVAVELPGVTSMSLAKLGSNFAKEGSYLDLYQTAPYDPGLRKAGGHDQSSLRRTAGFVKWLPQVARSRRYANALAKDIMADHLSDALRANPDLNVNLVNGAQSTISPHERNVEIVNQLKAEGHPNVRLTTYPGEPHAVDENPHRLAYDLRLALGLPMHVEEPTPKS